MVFQKEKKNVYLIMTKIIADNKKQVKFPRISLKMLIIISFKIRDNMNKYYFFSVYAGLADIVQCLCERGTPVLLINSFLLLQFSGISRCLSVFSRTMIMHDQL